MSPFSLHACHCYLVMLIHSVRRKELLLETLDPINSLTFSSKRGSLSMIVVGEFAISALVILGQPSLLASGCGPCEDRPRAGFITPVFSALPSTHKDTRLYLQKSKVIGENIFYVVNFILITTTTRMNIYEGLPSQALCQVHH